MSDVREYEASEGWGGDVRFVTGYEGFAYRPNEVITGGDQGRDAAQRLFPGVFPDSIAELVFPETTENVASGRRYLLRGVIDPIDAVEELRSEGFAAQPNHVMFVHGGNCCGPHPAQRWQGCLSGSPVYASPVYASPVYASPVYASPVYASPVYASELHASGRRRSSAVPTTGLPVARLAGTYPERPVRVAVLDTGMAGDGYRPAALDAMTPSREHWERPDTDGDLYLDPAAGHGTFIAGLIELVTPGCEITVEKVLSSYGEGDEVAIARRVYALAGAVDLINLSFGGYALERMNVLAAAVRRATSAGTVVVASAGNDGTCRPTYPAALPDVVGVGAIGPNGPAPFTNYGAWVRACAPGVDVVSWFFSEFDGPGVQGPGSIDPDHFENWARWSGTSFAAPIVVAALAREMHIYAVDAPGAVRRVIDGPGLLRIPELGTVVNLG